MNISYRAINDGLTRATGCFFRFMSATYQVSNLRAVEHRGCLVDPLKIVADVSA
jgi:hypothetical protein